MDKPACTDGLWQAFAGTPPLCDTCQRRSWGQRVLCTIDPLRVTAWTCRDYLRGPGSDDDF